MSKQHAREHARGPKFKVGDRVLFGDQLGEVVEVPEFDERALADHGQLYSVQLEPWDREEYVGRYGATQVRYRNALTDETRDHASDTHGCVPEADLRAVK